MDFDLGQEFLLGPVLAQGRLVNHLDRIAPACLDAGGFITPGESS